MKTCTPFLLLISWITKCACECPYLHDNDKAFTQCVANKNEMDSICPHFYCGTGRTCDKNANDPHKECRDAGSVKTSGYCHSAGQAGYLCGELADGAVPSVYKNGQCIHSGDQGGACGQTICPAGMFGSKTWAKDPVEVVWFPETCQICPDGSYSSSTGSPNCQCPAHGKEASSNPATPELMTQVRDCPPGTFNDRSYIDEALDHNDATLWRPPIGSFKGTPCGKCEACPDNSFSKGSKGNSHCQCGPLGHQAKASQTGAEQCPKGKYQHLGLTWTRTTKCPICKPCSSFKFGSFADTEGQEHCQCPKGGYEATKEGDGARPCSPGTYKNDTSCAICAPCPSGTFQGRGGSHGCDIPSIGHYALNSTVETSCQPGSFKHGSGPALECKKCAAGYYAPNQAADLCLAADFGHEPFAPKGKAGFFTSQIPCEPGFHQNEKAKPKCKQCKDGTFSIGQSQSICDCASSGHVVDNSRRNEIPCPLGKYTKDEVSRMDRNCWLNDTSTGNWDCTECETGRFGEHRHADNCSECPEGKYQALTGRTVCPNCPVNSYSAFMGSSTCAPCFMWEFQDEEGSKSCDNCFTVEAAFGFAYPDQCLVIWFVLAAVAIVVTVILVLKFCNAFSGCCSAVVMMCQKRQPVSQSEKTIVINNTGLPTGQSGELEEFPPGIPTALSAEDLKPAAKRQSIIKRKSTNIVRDYDDSDSDEF